MIEIIREALSPYYIYLKFVHLLFVMIWTWSTTHAFMYYLVPVFQAWRRNPADKETLRLRNWVMERFDDGVLYEHIAFPMVLITGTLLFITGQWNTSPLWLSIKLSVVIMIFLPMEILDIYLSHMGGNKERIRQQGDMARYEAMVQWHWLFFLVATPLVILFALGTIFLANVKPI